MSLRQLSLVNFVDTVVMYGFLNLLLEITLGALCPTKALVGMPWFRICLVPL